MGTITRAEAIQHIADTQAALTAARKAQQYSVGDTAVSRARISDLTADLAYWQRVVSEIDAESAGADNPSVMTAQWD